MKVILDINQRVSRASEGFTLSVENVLQVGFNLFRKSPAIFILYGLISLLVFSNPVSGLLLGGPITVGYYVVAHRVQRNRQVELPDFFRGFDRFLPLLLLNLLITVVVVLGLLLLVVPGVYFAISYILSHFFVWFYHEEPTEAVSLSRKTVSGNFGQIFLLCLVLAGINLLGTLAFGVGLLLTVPFSYCVLYAAFDDIIGIP